MPDKTRPYNIEAEEACLGALLLDPAALPKIRDELRPSDFYLGRHQIIFDAIVRLADRRAPFSDILVLSEELERNKNLDAIGGITYLAQLPMGVSSAVNIGSYAGMILETSRKRQALTIAEELAKAAFDDNGKLAHDIPTIQARLAALLPSAAPETAAAPAIPPLPEIGLEPALARETGAWVDAYTAHALNVSPMTPTAFHESAALWLVSSAVARRLVLNMAFDRIYPDLWVMWVAPSTLWSKSTSMNLARRVAVGAFPHLLTPEDMTPEGLMLDMAGAEPANLYQLRMEDQTAWQERRNFSAQRGWTMDEFSGLLANAGKDYNAGLIETLMRFYDCTEKYDRLTAGRGLQCIHNAYLTLLSASTPVAMASHLVKERLWGMGFWPRFAILAPEQSRPDWIEAVDAEAPAALASGLRALYDRLPKPRWPDPLSDIPVLLGDGVMELWNRYAKLMRHDLLTSALDHRLWAAYGRLPIHALKIAILLAALDWGDAPTPRIELPHFTRALLTVETWRASLHLVLDLAAIEEADRVKQTIVAAVAKNDPGGATMRDLCKANKSIKPRAIEDALEDLLLSGDIIAVELVNPRGGPRTTRYMLNRG